MKKSAKDVKNLIQGPIQKHQTHFWSVSLKSKLSHYQYSYPLSFCAEPKAKSQNHIIQQRTLALRINLFQLPIYSASHSQLLGVRWRLRTGLAKVGRTPVHCVRWRCIDLHGTLAPQVGSSFLNSVPSINFSMSRNLRVLVFDFDGTLWIPTRSKLRIFLNSMQSMGTEYSLR